MITYDDFKKVEIRAGKIISAEKIPNTDKLLKLMVDFGEFEEVKSETIQNNDQNKVVAAEDSILAKTEVNKSAPANTETVTVETPKKIPKIRQIVSGIALKFPDTAALVGKTCMFVTNLEPRMIKGFESNGMLFAVSTPEGHLRPDGTSAPEGGFSLLEPNSTIPPGTMAV